MLLWSVRSSCEIHQLGEIPVIMAQNLQSIIMLH